MDLVYYAKSLRILKALTLSLMNENEKHLSMYQYQYSLKLYNQDSSNGNEKVSPQNQAILNLLDRKNDK